ncbi:MAG: response regulator [Deltaproteobacteria bacterium]|nr:response regulator [Deltaproteobacteria bacterium]
MIETDILKDKKVLIVDDEPDIIAVLEEMLDMCIIDKASDFQTAQDLLDKNNYDAAILDIMGVKGYDLLDLTLEKGIPTLMLTAHAMTPDDFVKSLQKGAHAFIPKDKITDIAVFLIDILESDQKGLKGIGKWFTRLEEFFEKKFGYYWKEKAEEDPDFWKNLY